MNTRQCNIKLKQVPVRNSYGYNFACFNLLNIGILAWTISWIKNDKYCILLKFHFSVLLNQHNLAIPPPPLTHIYTFFGCQSRLPDNNSYTNVNMMRLLVDYLEEAVLPHPQQAVTKVQNRASLPPPPSQLSL